MRRPYEVDREELEENPDEFVSAVFADLTSSFLVMPKGQAEIRSRRLY